MLGLKLLAGTIAAAAFFAAATAAPVQPSVRPLAPLSAVVPVKLGFNAMNKTEQDNLWKMVDQYATVDALQEFCGNKLNLQRRVWRAVAACVEAPALRKVNSVFATKKAEYLKAWQTLHGEEERKKLVCERFKTKLGEYSKIINGQISEAASMCRNCFFC
jgi:hypothetical protein